MTETLRLEIRGRVQGVGYRAWFVEAAHAHGLSGWVRNRADGSVEALVTGEQAALDALAIACETGPRFAQVSGVTVSPALPDANLEQGRLVQLPTL